MRAHGGFVHAVGDPDRIERPQPLAFPRQHRQTQLRQRLEERAMIPLVASPARVEPFLFDDRQRFVQRVDQRGRHRVVVLAAQPVVLEQREVEVEAAAFHPLRERARTEHDGREARRPAQAFLRARVRGIHAPAADVERHAAQRRDGVDDGQRAVLARNRGEIAHRVDDAGGRFGMDHRHHVRRRSLSGAPSAPPDRRPFPTPRRAA